MPPGENADHLQQYSLIQVVNEASLETVEVHVPCGQNDVCDAETQQANKYRQALRQSHVMNWDYDQEQALRMFCFCFKNKICRQYSSRSRMPGTR